MYAFTRLLICAFARHFRDQSTQGTSYTHTHTHTHKIKSGGKIIKPAKMNRWAKQVSSLLILLINVRMLQRLTLYIFRQGLPHWNSAEGLFRYSMVCR